MQSGSSSESSTTEVNVVPLIDVSLVLVVILILLTPLGFESKIALHRAVASAKESAKEAPVELLELVVLDEVEVRVNRTNVPREKLEETLRPLLAGSAPPPVVVSCVDAVSHGTFVNVLDVAKQCGAQEIAVTESAP